MHHRITGLVAFLVAAVFAGHAGALDLREFVAEKDDVYGWARKSEWPMPGGVTAHVLDLTSQTWHGIVWKHRLVVLLPSEMERTDLAMLLITGGSNKPKSMNKMPSEALLLADACRRVKTPVAVLSQVPNQPLFGGKYEDEIIAHTFRKFLQTGDATWPLLLPMVKSAVRSMDAVQEFLAREKGQKVARYFVTGASKRGWTTWLTGASDDRVAAIAPMVIDMVNLPRQMRHQLEAWGDYSPSIADYTKLGIAQAVENPEAAELLSLVDPYRHLTYLTMPKFVILGTNDDYWPVDAAKHYFFDLPGERHLHYVPNAGHGLDLSVVETIVGYYQTLVAKSGRPAFDWKFTGAGKAPRLSVHCEAKPVSVSLWTATSDKRDFRKAKWTDTDMTETEGGVFEASIPVPEPGAGYVAVYAALAFKSPQGATYRLCTNTEVYPQLNTEEEFSRR